MVKLPFHRMAILNKEKSTFVPVVRMIVHNILYIFFLIVCACMLYILQK